MLRAAFIFSVIAASALAVQLQGQDLSFHHLNKQSGFSQSVCYDVLKDREGFVWITTISGLYRYDGNRFEDFTKENEALKGHALVSMIEDLNGDFWLTRFGDGLVRYNRQHNTFEIIGLKALSPAIPQDLGLVELLHVDGENHLWMQLNDSLLARFDPQRSTIKCYSAEGLVSLKIFPGDEAKTPCHLVAKRRRDGKVFKGMLDTEMQVLWTDSIADWPASSITLAMSDADQLWGIDGNTLYLYSFLQKTTSSFTMPALANVAFDPNSMYVDPSGQLWLSANEGLLQISTGASPGAIYHHHRPDDAYSIAGKGTPKLVDREGILWTTVYGKGISYAHLNSTMLPNIFAAAKAGVLSANNYVRAITAGDDGALFVAVQSGGVLRLDSAYTLQARALPEDAGVVEHLLYEKEKGLWMAGNALYFKSYDTQGHQTHKPPLSDFGGFTVVHRADDGQLIAGGYSCLLHFDERGGSFHLPKGIPQNGTYCTFYNLDHNHLLACRRDEGVSVYEKDGDDYTLVKEVDANLYVKCILNARNGDLLLATTVGLYRYNAQQQTVLAVEEVNSHLPNMYMYSLLQDDLGRYWASTNGGLCAWDEGATNFLWYDMGHGLQDMEFNTNAYCKMPNGDLLFGGVNGINLVAATYTKPASFSTPPLRLLSVSSRDIQLNYGSIPGSGVSIFMGWGMNALELEYATLEYFRPERVNVRYRLAGHDDDWQEGPAHGRVRFANVAPGSYQYEMQTSDANGNWDDKIHSWHLLTKPLWWQTWWARAAVVLVVLGMSIFAVKAYTARKLQGQRETMLREVAVQQERERITADLHDDIGATLSSMYLYGDLASTVWQDKPEESRKMLGTITTQSRELMQRMGDIVWSLKSNDELSASLSVRLRNHARELIEGTGIKVKFEIDEALDRSLSNPVVRKNLLLIAKEAMNNAVKYSEAKAIELRLHRENGTLQLQITDDGRGFDMSKTSAGNGLQNIRQRCERLGGMAHIASAPGEGCSVRCTLPIAIISQGRAF